MTHRIAQLESTLKKEIGKLLSEGLADPRIRGLISVTSVKLSPDHRLAQVDVSVMPSEHAELSLHGLRHAARHLRNELGRRVRTRAMPRLDFHLDDSLKKQAEVLGEITRAVRDDQSRHPPEGSGADPDHLEDRTP